MEFSVIITTHNRPYKILKTAIDSVVNQTLKAKEIIVINDNPHYLGNEKIESLIKSYENNVTYICNKETYGANKSRNIGIKKATGEIIALLDDDDYWDKNRLKVMKKYFDLGYDVVYSDMYIFNEKKLRKIIRGETKPDKIIEKLLEGNYWGGFSNVCFTKKIFLKSNMLDESVISYQDLDLWIRMAQYGKIKYISEPLLFYRESENSISLNSNKKLYGLLFSINKYSDLYSKYPKSLEKRINNELVFFLKNGWYNNVRKIINIYGINFNRLFALVKGFFKRLIFLIIK